VTTNKKLDRKKLFYYITFVVSGYVIDLILDYFNFNLLYSFKALFLIICICHMRSNDRDTKKNSWSLLEKLLYFVILPVLYSLLMNFCS